MADKKISQLTSLAPALNTDQLPINRSNASGKLTVADILVPEATIRAAKDGDLTTLTTTANTNLVSAINEVNAGLATKIPTSYLDADTSLTANSDSKVATQKATKAYVLANATPSATESVQGKAEIATQGETNTGTDDVRFVTPLKLKTNLATYGYLTGSGTANFFPKYTAGAVLGNSALAQSATGNRILVNGVTDDTATAFQVSGSIRQTTVTTKIAALDANGKIVSGGSGTANYLTKWNATNGITSSLIQDNGTSVGILASPVGFSAMSFSNSTIPQNIYSLNSYVDPSPSFGQINYGLYQTKTGANTGYNVAGYFQTTSAATGNYALQLIDGTETVAGRFLKNITTDGRANWASITTADITSGFSGNSPYLARWTGVNTLGSSTITDNGSQVGIGNAPLSNSKLYVAASTTIYGINVTNTNTSGITFGVRTVISGANASENVGVAGYATNSTTLNTGILGSAVAVTAGKNVGGYFIASNGATNYSVQLKDGTEAAGKILQCVDANGSANWVSHYIVNTILVNTAFTNEAISINFDLGNYVILDYSSAIAVATSTNAVTFSNMKQGRTYKIKVKQGTSSAGETYTPTFAAMKWPGGTAFTPTTGTGKIDFIEVYYDGIAYYGNFIKNYV